MRPHTVHAGAQLVRHTRGLLTTIEKWAANTPPADLHWELTELLRVMRDGLIEMNTALGGPRPSAAPTPAPGAQPDRPAEPRPPDRQR